MATDAVAFPHLPYLPPLCSEQGVDQGGLSHSGRAQERDRLSWLQVVFQCFQPSFVLGADGVNIHTRGCRFYAAYEPGDIGAQVGLVEQDCRGGPAVPGEREIALDTAYVRASTPIHISDDADGLAL